MLENVGNFGHAFVLKSPKGVYFWRSPDVLVVVVVVLDALGAQGFDAGAGRAEVGEGLSLVLHAGVLDELGGEFGGVEVGVVAASHLNLRF